MAQWESDHIRVEERSIELHRAIAAKLMENPQAVLEKARANIRHLRWVHGGASEPYLAAWEALLDGTIEDLAKALISPSEEFRALRQATPFAGVLTPAQRWAIYRSFRERWLRNHAP